MSVAEFVDGLDLTPDPFQITAIEAVADGRSVVVAAPTGSGKTLIAEGAVHLALEQGRRAFYTTPIKALSNQKYADFVEMYGATRVGLLTGDNSINGSADIVVMTTEVLRNMIYADADALHDLGVVVLDEVHYLQDRFRGQVWEEIIIHLSKQVILVCLSATIANPEEFAGWVAARRGEVELVVETHRPVPLESLYLVRDRSEGLLSLAVLPRGRPNADAMNRLRKGRSRRYTTPRRGEVVEFLDRRDLLPAIYFVFSRIGCESAAERVARSDLNLTTPDERAEIRRIAEERTAHLPPADLRVLGYAAWLEVLSAGVAAHHAGLVPAFKETVEVLFGRELIKVVFATETLALGINMPARSVVIEKLSKFSGDGHELLQPGDYTQLTGRAGRRGIDVAGTAVVLHSAYVPFDRVAAIAAAGSHPLRSAFQPNYNMAVNLIANYSRPVAEDLLRASFAQFRSESRLQDIDRSLAAAERDRKLFAEQAACDRGDIWEYESLRSDGSGTENLLAFARDIEIGDVIELGAGRGVVLARGYGDAPRLLTLMADGGLRRLRPRDFDLHSAKLGAMPLADPIKPRDRKYQHQVLHDLERWVPQDPRQRPERPPAADHPVATCPDLAEHLQWVARLSRVDKELRRLRRRRERPEGTVVGQFHSLLGVLEQWRAVDGWALTDRGDHLRGIYAELDLLVVAAIDEGLLDELAPGELAAVAASFVYEPRLRDLAGDWPTPETKARGEEIEHLARELRRAEAQRGLPESRPPNPGFSAPAYAWALGADLIDLLGDDEFAAGDFVRNCRQLLDLLRQIRDEYPHLAETVGAAVKGIDRGVVAAGGQLR